MQTDDNTMKEKVIMNYNIFYIEKPLLMFPRSSLSFIRSSSVSQNRKTLRNRSTSKSLHFLGNRDDPDSRLYQDATFGGRWLEAMPRRVPQRKRRRIRRRARGRALRTGELNGGCVSTYERSRARPARRGWCGGLVSLNLPAPRTTPPCRTAAPATPR